MEQIRGGAEEFALLSDEPIMTGDGDLLDGGRAARELAALLLASRGATPFTLAVDAGRGMGKSTLMHLVDTELKRAGVCTVWYDAWTAGREDYLEGLMKTTLRKLDKRVLRRKMAQLSGNRALVRVVRMGLVMAAAPLGVGRAVDEIWRSLSADAGTRNEMRDAVKDLVGQWMDEEPGAPSRYLVVFIDDLDRCTDAAVRAVSEAVKVYLGVPGIAFVVGCDRSPRSAATLLRDYSPEAAEFMEKIFQTTYRIPAPNDEGTAKYIRGCAARCGVDRLLDDRLTALLADRTARNPRRIKRLLNGFVLESRLNPLWKGFAPEVLFRTVLLQYSYADFYRLLVGDEESSRDAVSEFQAYHRIRQVLRRVTGTDPTEESWVEVARFFAEYKVSPPLRPDHDDWGRSLAELERELPSGFAELAADRQFVSLVAELMQMSEAKKLVEQLRRQPLVVCPGVEGSSKALEAGGAEPLMTMERAYQGLRVLWVDDHPKHSERIARELRSKGAEVTEERDAGAANNLLRSGSDSAHTDFNLLISDFAREGDSDAGFRTVQDWRKDGTYTQQVIFFSHRVTPAREARAAELKARVTSSEDQLLRSAFGAARRIREEGRPGPRP